MALCILCEPLIKAIMFRELFFSSTIGKFFLSPDRYTHNFLRFTLIPTLQDISGVSRDNAVAYQIFFSIHFCPVKSVSVSLLLMSIQLRPRNLSLWLPAPDHRGKHALPCLFLEASLQDKLSTRQH